MNKNLFESGSTSKTPFFLHDMKSKSYYTQAILIILKLLYIGSDMSCCIIDSFMKLVQKCDIKGDHPTIKTYFLHVQGCSKYQIVSVPTWQ